MVKARKKVLFFETAILLFGFFVLQNFYFADNVMADGVVENLDEVVLRKLRILNMPSWGANLLENSANNYIWQPEMLQYVDVLNGNEVWKITNTPAGTNNTQDISTTHWSANGNWIMFHSLRNTNAFSRGGLVNDNGYSYSAIASAGSTLANRPPNATYWKRLPFFDASLPNWVESQWYEYPSKIWMLSSTDGGRLLPAKNSSSRSPNWLNYIAWNPAKADEFLMGGSESMGEGTQTNSLYRNTVDAAGVISKAPILTTENPTGRLSIKKSMAPDGSNVYLNDIYTGKAYAGTLIGTPSLDTPIGYSRELPFDNYWGQAPTAWAGYHDEFLAGAVNGEDGLWHYIMPESSNGPWWRAKIVGSGAGGQPIHTQDHDAPYAWGNELEPVNTKLVNHLGIDPWNLVQYPSHFTPDRWGHYAIFSKVVDSPFGSSLLDFRTHDYWKPYPDNAFSGAVPGVQHHDWEAWSDWSVSSGQPAGQVGYDLYRVVAQNYRNQSSQKMLCSAHVRENGDSAPYDSLTRPTQSSDGTKAMFNSTFLNVSDDDIQLFWTVAYYPYPPEIKSAVKNVSDVRLTWDFNQGENCSVSSQNTPRTGPTPNFTTPRTYATRGWPHETLDCPPSPREIKNFRVWQSSDNLTWTQLGTTSYNNCSGDNECGMWTEISWNYDASQPNNTTRYYAVTSLEHSGLESRSLSNTWKVITDSNGNITEQTQQSSYPTNPGSKSNFFTTTPSAPTLISANHKESPATADGQYTIRWTAPTNKDLIRYYTKSNKFVL
ncbi:MAG: hypothetical protein UR99_C0003G0001 [Candidatus Moranbacteria bacterium GW2011_GWD2_36_12]|nr:MAG: hypothetical protein UR99_C0003G0001 [Candidatus Moranbacteria bacterium GW2011_GWD2_36_12]KKQ06943.1 MAG: hypothetical protein US16_C0005G0001 [Candidatus Moranbacteria bacterium GW2011_GWE2_36_40]